MKIENLSDAFVFLRGEGSASVALIDCMNAYSLGKADLEKYFDSQLWLSEEVAESPFSLEAAQQYYIELSTIEEFLVHQGLIYND